MNMGDGPIRTHRQFDLKLEMRRKCTADVSRPTAISETSNTTLCVSALKVQTINYNYNHFRNKSLLSQSFFRASETFLSKSG